jgi:Spy/CpxP family protein refolding chaperone
MEKGPRKGGMHSGPQRMLKALDLTDEQKDKLKALRKARRDSTQKKRNSVMDLREDLKDMLAKPDRSKDHEQKLRQKSEELLTAIAEAGRERFESVMEIRAILDDAQLKKFKDAMEEGGGEWGRRKMEKREGRKEGKDRRK